MNREVESIFKVIHYEHIYSNKRKLPYPTFRVNGSNEIYFKNIEDVESYMQKEADFYKNKLVHQSLDDNYMDILYAYVILEIPLKEVVNVDALDQYLSFRTYLPDGTLWGKNEYGHFMSRHATGDEYNYWGRKNQFWGRKPDEIKFKPGDIVEVLGCPGNVFWSNETVDLAIVTKVPPTIAEVEDMRKKYIETHSGYDLCDHAMSIEFDHSLDTYEVIPYAYGNIDHAPTACVFKPTKQISAQRKKHLMNLYEKNKLEQSRLSGT
ncbi:MAG: hypothetical protein IKT00_02470 [Prevotella sp.]|nr:hypothetical protein [Prevotella sp.]